MVLLDISIQKRGETITMKMRYLFTLVLFHFFSLVIVSQDTIYQTSFSDPVKFENDFQSQYKSKEFQYELPKNSKPEKDINVGLWSKILNNLVQYFLYALLILGIIIIIKELAKRINLGHQNNEIESQVRILNGDEEMNFSEENLDKLITDNISKGNYRMAVRYQFIKLLKKMVSKNIIVWDADKTNTDYRYEINSSHISEKFEQVSRIYEYFWYGEFLLDSPGYYKAESLFLDILDEINDIKTSEQ